MSASRAKKVKMATKSCPECDLQVPVACKSCPCGYIFINRKLLKVKQSDKSSPFTERQFHMAHPGQFLDPGRARRRKGTQGPKLPAAPRTGFFGRVRSNPGSARARVRKTLGVGRAETEVKSVLGDGNLKTRSINEQKQHRMTTFPPCGPHLHGLGKVGAAALRL